MATVKIRDARGLETGSITAPVEYRATGISQRWLDECVIRDPDSGIRSSELYAAYCAWCLAEGVAVCSHKSFSARIKRAGYQIVKSNAMIVIGLRLSPAHSASPQPLGS